MIDVPILGYLISCVSELNGCKVHTACMFTHVGVAHSQFIMYKPIPVGLHQFLGSDKQQLGPLTDKEGFDLSDDFAQKLEQFTLKEQEVAHPTLLKPSTVKPTPSSEGTDSGVGDSTVSQHGPFHPVSSSCLPVPPISSPIAILANCSSVLMVKV